MPKGSPELTRARREEIINACAKLYETLTFKDVTIKEIANFTSFTRPSIYNYFRTKEEIFLALLQREYEGWTTDLNLLCREHKTMSRDAFADAFARSLVPGQKSSVCIQRIIPNFISVTSVKARFLHAPQNIGFRVSYSCGSLRRYTTVSRPVFPISFFPFPCKRMLNYYIKSP